MPTLKANSEILIAGAVPTGLALAAELLRRGIMATIIDRQAGDHAVECGGKPKKQTESMP